MTVELTDKRLKEAVLRADLYRLAALPEDSRIDHEFSPEFLEKMRELIRQNRSRALQRRGTWKKRLAVGVAAALILLSTTAMTIPPVREKVIEFVMQVYEQFTHLSFSGPGNTAGDAAFQQALPSYIPEGFELVINDLDGIVLLVYEKEADNISYEQIRKQDVSMHINTGGVELEELEFQGLPAKYYSNQGQQNLMWYDDDYFYMVSSTLDRDTVFRIAESVKIP